MLPSDPVLRTTLEKAVLEARNEAEKAARVALRTLAVDRPDAFSTLTKEQRELRNALRAKGRLLGAGDRSAGFAMLVEEVAYAQWHRMLFARFLAENDLLMHPIGVAVTLDDCEELAAEEGDPDQWMTAARYAGRMLPGIFRADDPTARVSFAPEGRAALEAILVALSKPIFTSEYGLGWVYQFWQSKKKKEVSASGNKIEKLDLAAYSQLFTEDYMVRFLLENSLGAWWAGRHPDSTLVKDFKYLRFRDDGTPAAGKFSGWPERAADVTIMDPCCGSGHFLIVAFEMLRWIRMEEENLSEVDAGEAVLRDNLFGLEIDPRCVQIAAFAIALAAWKAGGYRKLPLPNIACSGIPINGQLEEWTHLADSDANMQLTLERLYGLFLNAPDLGSLINPADVPLGERMFAPDFASVTPLLEDALGKEKAADPVTAVFGNTALGVARAAELLARQYTLVATNVPYLARGKQGEELKAFIERNHAAAKTDLATAFIERCRAYCCAGGAYAVVTPQNWLLLSSYKKLRQTLLQEQDWRIVARLGPSAFETVSGEVVNVALLVLSNDYPADDSIWAGIDVLGSQTPQDKDRALVTSSLRLSLQAAQMRNPDSRITFIDLTSFSLLEGLATSYQGIKTGDDERFRRRFWEVALPSTRWVYYQSTVDETKLFGGLEYVLDWSYKGQNLARLQGLRAWNKPGVAVSPMGELRSALYLGTAFDSNMAAVIPEDSASLPAVWAFCSSPEFDESVRQIDTTLKVTNATLVKVPFDAKRWEKAAADMGPLPKPFSKDPTQWLSTGDPGNSTESLQVALARLLGYDWPRQDVDRLSPLKIQDGILLLSPTLGQEPASEQLHRVLASAYEEGWSNERQRQLLSQVGFVDKGLDAWLRDGFFEQHCKLFHQRPFIWHIWDGRRDGFSALVNYHKLDVANLNKLIYTYLGEWIRAQRAAEDSGTSGADARLRAALELQKKLEAIRDGEPPYDIYVRWKPLHEQPIGWDPDPNDGVRLNIRPFVIAGVLHSKMKVHWRKDRGRNADGSERMNDCHRTLAEKRTAREETKT